MAETVMLPRAHLTGRDKKKRRGVVNSISSRSVSKMGEGRRSLIHFHYRVDLRRSLCAKARAWLPVYYATGLYSQCGL